MVIEIASMATVMMKTIGVVCNKETEPTDKYCHKFYYI